MWLRESEGGVAREEGEANEVHDCFARDDGDDAAGDSIGGDGGDRKLPGQYYF
jgi:hypothetical protein